MHAVTFCVRRVHVLAAVLFAGWCIWNFYATLSSVCIVWTGAVSTWTQSWPACELVIAPFKNVNLFTITRENNACSDLLCAAGAWVGNSCSAIRRLMHPDFYATLSSVCISSTASVSACTQRWPACELVFPLFKNVNLFTINQISMQLWICL